MLTLLDLAQFTRKVTLLLCALMLLHLELCCIQSQGNMLSRLFRHPKPAPKMPPVTAPACVSLLHSGGGMGILTSDFVFELSLDFDSRSRDDRRSRDSRSCSRSALRDSSPGSFISSFTPLQQHAK